MEMILVIVMMRIVKMYNSEYKVMMMFCVEIIVVIVAIASVVSVAMYVSFRI